MSGFLVMGLGRLRIALALLIWLMMMTVMTIVDCCVLFFRAMLGCEELQKYDRARVFLDEDYTAADKFTVSCLS